MMKKMFRLDASRSAPSTAEMARVQRQIAARASMVIEMRKRAGASLFVQRATMARA